MTNQSVQDPLALSRPLAANGINFEQGLSLLHILLLLNIELLGREVYDLYII